MTAYLIELKRENGMVYQFVYYDKDGNFSADNCLRWAQRKYAHEKFVEVVNWKTLRKEENIYG